LGNAVVDNVRAAGLMVMDSGPVVLSCGLLASVTFTCKFEVPAVVGVPLTVQPLNVSPAGSVPEVIEQL
jgi:hypothetical protein